MNKEEKTIEIRNRKYYSQYYVNQLQQENKQLKEQLENKIDLYEDTISYQLGFDKGKEYLQQIIDKAIEYIKENSYIVQDKEINGIPLMSKRLDKCDDLLEILGDKENEEI